MSLIKKKDGKSALDRLRQQKDIHEAIKSGKARAPGVREALVILLDLSPSMSVHQNAAEPGSNLNPWAHEAPRGETAWDAAVRAARTLIDASVQSEVGAVAFCAHAPPHRRCEVGKKVEEIIRFLKQFDPMRDGMGTDFTCAINAGLDLLAMHEGRELKRMILMTDGRDGCHSGMRRYEEMLSRLGRSGVVLDTVGFGDVDPDQLERLAKLGGGTFHRSASVTAFVKEVKCLEAGARGLLGRG